MSNYFENDQKKRAEIKVEKDLPTWDSRFDYLSQKELQNLAGVVEKRMDKAKGKMELLKSMNVHIGSSSLWLFLRLFFSKTKIKPNLTKQNQISIF